MKTMTRSEAVARALSWEGTPYHPSAYIKGVGVDCAMILVGVYAGQTEVPADFDPRPYPNDWHLHRDEERYLGWLRQFADEVVTPEPADVLIWKFGRAFAHAAIALDTRGNIVHAYRKMGFVVRGNVNELDLATMKSGQRRERLVFRVRGVTP